MKILFIDTSSFFVSVGIIDDNKIIKLFQEEVRDDMSSKIMPVISQCFDSVAFSIKDIDKIMVVNGPGSFTGVRIGVTIAKVLAWSLKKEIIAISSLEYLASSDVSTKYIIPMIDARRGYVYGGVYDSELNPVVEDTYALYESFEPYFSEGTIISLDELNNSEKPNFDILKIVNKHINDSSANFYSLKPNYLKKTEAEEKLEHSND